MAIERVKSGNGNDSDKAIFMLLEHNKKFKQEINELKAKIDELITNGGKDDVPEYQKIPWYMR